jgi:hypothetical protein
MISLYPGGQIELEAFIRTAESALAQAGRPGATAIVVCDAGRWSAADALKIGRGDPQTGGCELATIASIAADGVTVTLTAPLKRGHGIGQPVWRLIEATMTGLVETPDGTDTPITLSAVSTGRYRGSYMTTQSGPHAVEVTASGAATAAAALGFDVQSDVV